MSEDTQVYPVLESFLLKNLNSCCKLCLVLASPDLGFAPVFAHLSEVHLAAGSHGTWTLLSVWTCCTPQFFHFCQALQFQVLFQTDLSLLTSRLALTLHLGFSLWPLCLSQTAYPVLMLDPFPFQVGVCHRTQWPCLLFMFYLFSQSFCLINSV